MNAKNFHPLSYKDQKLYFEDRSLKEIAQQFPTPFYLYSEKTLLENFKRFETAAQVQSKQYQLPKPLICFALKANPNLRLLQTLAAHGSGADIVSGGELKRALEAGIDPQKIVFSGVGKTQAEMQLALEASADGIYSFNIESLEELELLNRVAKKLNKKARVAFRFNPQVHAKTHKHISTGHKTHKFGILKADIMQALQDQSLWQNAKLVGLSMHIGSQLTDLSATQLALIELAQCALELNQTLEFLDVGGGLGVDYSPQDKDHFKTPEEYMELVASTLDQYYYSQLPADFSRPGLAFEPGRVIAARAGIFVTQVIRTKRSGDCLFAIVDGGMNDFVRSSLYEAYHEIYPETQSDEKHKTDIVGPICETADCFGTGRMLPALKAGDLLCVGDTGAYGFSMASQYNMRSLPKEVVLSVDGKLE